MLTLKLRNLFLLAASFLYFLIRGKADKKIYPPAGGPKKILIIQLAKMGDMICTTPMFRAVKEKYPSSELVVAGDRVNAEVLSGNPDVDRYLVWNKKIEEKFDVAFLTGPGPETLARLYLSGIPLIVAPEMIGWTPLASKSYRLLTRLVKTQPHYIGRYAPREYLRMLEPIGIFSEDTRKHLAFSKKAEEKVSKFFQESNISLPTSLLIGIFPSTGNRIKLWGRDKFAKVADWLFQKYNAQIFILGSESERKEVLEMINFLSPSTKVINTLGLFNIDEFKALISKLSLLISVDTGPIYIAEAFGVPTIDIVGPVDERDQPPIGKIHKVVVASRAKPQMGVFNARVYDEKEARRQSDDITLEMVIKETEELLKNIKT